MISFRLKSSLIWPLLAFLVLTFSFSGRIISQTAKPATKYNPKKDTLIFPARKNIQETLVLAGSIRAETQSELRFSTSGRLAWVGAKLGDSVKKGQAIASLDREELKKQYQKYMNDYLTNRWNFEDVQDRYKDERDKLLVTDEIKRILERSNFSLTNAALTVEIQNIALKYATIYTPISGIVTAVDQPNAGINVTPATATFTIIDPQSLYFESEIDQEDVSRVSLSQAASVNLDSFPDTTHSSRITYISFTPVSGQTSTTYHIRFELPVDNSSLNYRLGMAGDATISLKEAQNTLTVPVEAVYEDSQIQYVLVKKADNQVVEQPVKTGIESDIDIEILEGLSESDQVVIRKSS
ncbi:MAG: efflux RND transporter periplasmic adaptor subunit [Candidatus Shapirobacteria bacterium]|jgi:RND family efflux transporter MFP subunit